MEEAERTGVVRAFTAVRPTLLTNGEARGVEKLRVGTEEEPAIGYTISREDVGMWMFEELMKGGGQERWKGKKVSLTY